MSTTGLLTADWRDLVMLSYEIDPLLLVPHVPGGTSLDFHDGRALVTLVGLRMLNLRVAGIPVPFLQEFEQVNFRFYVWRREGHQLRRGVVFIREIVPSASMTLGARLLFNEHYVTAPMRHEVADPEHGGQVTYEWQAGGRWNRLSAQQLGAAGPMPPASIEAFVKDRPWGYAQQRDGSTLEYFVEHPDWDVRAADAPVLECGVDEAFGRRFVSTLARPPISAFVAVGSEATVHPGRKLD